MSADVAVLVGASASGKSRLLAGVQRIAMESGVLTGIRIVERFTTRLPRENESLRTENRHLDIESFESAVRAGQIDVHWRRAICPGQENLYGFSLAPELARNCVVVLSANNYLHWTADPLLRSLRAERRLMVIRILASDEARLARLRARQPKISASELASRMSDVPRNQLAQADHVIPNDPGFRRAPSGSW